MGTIDSERFAKLRFCQIEMVGIVMNVTEVANGVGQLEDILAEPVNFSCLFVTLQGDMAIA